MNTYKINIDGFEIEIEQLPNGKFKKPDISQKYKGLKYSIAPLKQTCEEVMIFQKPYKTKSCLHDVLAYENGDKTISCGALDIEGNRCGVEKIINHGGGINDEGRKYGNGKGIPSIEKGLCSNSGRYPAQTFCSDETALLLDKQSGVSKSNKSEYDFTKTNQGNSSHLTTNIKSGIHFEDTGGCSKILHKCNYELEEFDLLNYCPKVSPSERNAGLEEKWNMFEQREGFEEKQDIRVNAPRENETDKFSTIFKNNHPTLKPIKLIERILRLFKTPNPQKIYFPFAGSGSEIIGGIKAGFTDWEATEINEDYIKIAEARIKHWTEGSLF